MWALVTSLVVLGGLYIWRLNKLMCSQSPEAIARSPKRWTDEEIRSAYQQHLDAPLDVKPHLPPKTGNRYIVVGGNGFVGKISPKSEGYSLNLKFRWVDCVTPLGKRRRSSKYTDSGH